MKMNVWKGCCKIETNGWGTYHPNKIHIELRIVYVCLASMLNIWPVSWLPSWRLEKIDVMYTIVYLMLSSNGCCKSIDVYSMFIWEHKSSIRTSLFRDNKLGNSQNPLISLLKVKHSHWSVIQPSHTLIYDYWESILITRIWAG